jgi:hypothetical protein
MNAWHVETMEQREAISAKLEEMLTVLRRD